MAEVGGVCAVVEDSSGGDIVLAFVYTSAAGLSTVLGGMIPFFFNVNEKRWLGAGLGFAAGVMVYLSFVEILTKSHAYFVCVAGDDGAAWRTSLCFFSGMLIALGLSHVSHKLEDLQEKVTSLFGGKTLKDKDIRTYGSIVIDDDSQEHDVFEENSFVDEVEREDARRLSNMGLITALAICVHNFPEGMMTFVSTLSNPSFGLVVTLAIAIHNIPEGICVAMPIYYATRSKWQGVLYCLIAGISMPIGAFIAWGAVGGTLSPIVYAILFGLIAGIMVFISVRELIPTAHRYDKSDGMATYAMLFGMALMAFSLFALGE